MARKTTTVPAKRPAKRGATKPATKVASGAKTKGPVKAAKPQPSAKPVASAKPAASAKPLTRAKPASVSVKGLPNAKPQRAKPHRRAKSMRTAKFALGQIVRHRIYAFRGVVFDIDPVFNNTEDWWLAIPSEIRPRKDQPFYHLLAENDETEYIAYVSEQNLLPDESGIPLRHPQLGDFFVEDDDGRLRAVFMQPN
jgi:heat shock protein HspQ